MAPSARDGELDLSESMELGRLAFLPTARGSFESGSTTWYGEVAERSFYVTPAASLGEPMPGGVAFETASVERGGWAWPTDRAFSSDARGGLSRKAGTASEWLRGRDGGLEQGWTFDTKPSGNGDLVVRVDASEGDFLHADDAGLHFEGDAGNVVYGHGTWIDGTGEKTAVAASWTRGAVELVVPAELVEESAYPATLDPLIGPELETDPAMVGPDDSRSEEPSVACTATMCMGLWKDSTGMSRVRFTPDGSFVDPVPIQHVTDPTAVFGGVGAMSDRFILVWSTNVNTPTETLFAQIYGEDGAPISSAQTLAGPASFFGPGVPACSPDRCVVVWSQGGTLSKRLDANGTVLDPFGTLVGPSASSREAVFDGTNFIISFGDGVKRLTPSGLTLEANPIPVFPGSFVGSLASNGTSTLALGSSQARRINSDGTLGMVVSLAGAFHSPAWLGGSYLAVRSNPPSGTVIGQRLDANGASIGDTITYGVLGLEPQRVVPRPGGGFVTHRTQLDAKVLSTDANGAPGSLFALNQGANPQHAPTVIAGQGQYLVAWGDRRLGASAVYGQRYTATGTPLDAVPIVLFSMPTPSVVRLVSGAFDGSNYLVAGNSQSSSVRAARVPPSGPPLDGPTGITLLANPPLIEQLAVSWDGATFAVTRLGNLGGAPHHLRVQRITPSGLLLDASGISVSTDDLYPALAASADSLSHVIVWRGEDEILRFRRFTSGGTFTGAATAVGSASARPVGVACTPATCLVYGTNFLRTVSGTNVPFPPGGPGAPQHSSGLTVGGSEFLLSRGGLDMFGVRLSTAAVPAAIGTWFNISQSPGQDEVATSAAALGDGGALAAYERNVPAENANRVFLRSIILSSPNGGVCTLAADCQSGNCVDGVCCNSACAGGTTDCQACSLATGAAADGTCGPIIAGTQCRASLGDCDVAEACDGSSAACPVDGFAPTSTECRASAGDCDVAETCTGSSATCPTDQLLAAATVCRASSDLCDVAETCSGASATCPANLVAPSSTVCRAANGDCDVSENCDGSSTACPGDSFEPASTSCRAAAGPCDVEESCTGSDADCPTDTVVASGISCRADNGECDVEDFCDGVATECEDEGEPANTPCGSAPTGDCDAQDTCEGGPGNTNNCTDNVQGDTTVCRDAASECDAEELCDGANAECPDDDFQADGAPCEDGVCDAGDCVPDVGGSGSGGSGSGGGPGTGGSGSGAGPGTGGSGNGAGPGTGGAGPGNGGGGPDGGSSSNGDGDGDGGESGGDGCSCSTPSESRSATRWPLSLALIAGLARRRRRVSAR